MPTSTLSQIGAVGAAAVLIVVAALMVAHAPPLSETEVMPPLGPPVIDPLQTALVRCSSIGAAAENDTNCQRAWVLNRERFLGLNPTEDARDDAANSASSDKDSDVHNMIDGVANHAETLAQPPSQQFPKGR